MEIVNLANRKEVEVNINGKECVMSLSLKNIQHFQESMHYGVHEAFDALHSGD